jgi:hypothetical protein
MDSEFNNTTGYKDTSASELQALGTPPHGVPPTGEIGPRGGPR